MGVNCYSTYHHAISAFGETGKNEIIDKQGDDELLVALKR